ncbi:3-oxoadipate enol-lactonase [Roseovarius sp. CAU 1744]|uniref:3-oxoadipate enol-lactonase n=1 Tax=Roseovarius sp. CAU 1744 TaxID=3140368 RepID=UPI00325C026E
MRIMKTNGVAHHWREDGDPNGQPVVFANSLGTDLRLWDALLPRLPDGFRLIRYDKRGHGLSECPDGPYEMDELVADAEGLIEGLGLGPVIFVGLSIGGMIGLALSAKRPDLMRALVLSNSACKMGTPEMWNARIDAIREHGIDSQAELILDRWFGAAFRETPDVLLWRAMLTRTPVRGYLGCCAAIAGTDLSDTTRRLRLPVLGIAGTEDGASPPEIVEETCALILGSTCHTIPAAGHLPCVETPAAYARILAPFLKEHTHV